MRPRLQHYVAEAATLCGRACCSRGSFCPGCAAASAASETPKALRVSPSCSGSALCITLAKACF